MKAITLITIVALICATNAFVTHEMHGSASKCVKDGLKVELLKVIPTLTNTTAAAELKHDINNPTSATMTSLDQTTWTQIRTFMGVPNPPNCGAAVLTGKTLSCLNILWKYFVPLNGCV